jgi:hypothetical protein
VSAPSAATVGAQAPKHAPADAEQRAVPAHAHELAAQLSTLFQRDVEIVKRLNDAHQRLANANERLYSRLAPDAFGLIYDRAATAPGTSPLAALSRNGGPDANSPMLEALRQIHWQIHQAFCAYQHACEQRRQLAVDVGELSHQLTQTLCAAGWSADQARHANVHELASSNRPALHVDRGDYAAERPA